MDNLLSTLIFILPGFMLYFWIQMFGINPVVKHSVVEFGALAALAWIPVTLSTIGVMSLYRPIEWSLTGIRDASASLSFVSQFLLLSILMSFLLSVIYAKFIYSIQMFTINIVRKWINKTPLSKSASVWEEVFLNDDIQTVGISKIGSETPDIVGCIKKVSRPFEPKRSIKLIYMEHCKMIVERYRIPITEVFVDIDSGTNIFIYDQKLFDKADKEYRKELKELEKPAQ